MAKNKIEKITQVKEVEVVLKDPFDNIKKLIVNENKISFINQYDTSFSLSNLQYPIQNDISGKTISELLKSLLIGNKIDVEKKFNDFLLKTVYRPISINIKEEEIVRNDNNLIEKIFNNEKTLKDFLKEQNIDPKSKEAIGIFKEYHKIQDKLKKELENLKSKVIDISNNDIEINR